MAKSPTRPAPRKRSQSRTERQEATRQKLIEAAASQIGSDGYTGASIQKITTSAEIANGTFYNYFDSQQDLFDKLLPELGENLLRYIRDAIREAPDGVTREERGFRAFFDYLAAHPAFYRVLNEAETFAPKAFASHMENMASAYHRALRHAAEKGELNPFSDRELEVVVYILLSARNYLAYRFTNWNGKVGRLPDWVTNAYMKFVSGGLVPSRGGRRIAAPDRPSPRRTDRYKAKRVPQGTSHLTMTISDALLDSFGSIEHGVIAGLVECAAIAAGPGPGGEGRVTNVSVSFVAPSHARSLVAKGKLAGRTGSTAHVGVTVHEQDDPDTVIATGIAVLSLAADG